MFVHLWYRPMVHVPVWYILQGALLGQEGDLVRLWIETAVRLKRVQVTLDLCPLLLSTSGGPSNLWPLL